MRSRAGLHLDGDMAEAGDAGEPLLIDARRLGPVADEAQHRGVVPGAMRQR